MSPLRVQFENRSANYQSISWDFSDNLGQSTVENPEHIYTQVGSYDVSLIAIRSEQCQDTLTIEKYVSIDGPVGDFSYKPIRGCLPHEVTFTSKSELPNIYSWDFDNGTLITREISKISDTITFTYSLPGTYLPRFELEDNNGCSIVIAGDDSIHVADLSIDFDVQLPDSCTYPTQLKTFNFSSDISDDISFEWVLSSDLDTVSKNEIQPSFDILHSGFYNLGLQVESSLCSDYIEFPKGIFLGDIPTVDAGEDLTICLGEEVELQGVGEGLVNWTSSEPLYNSDILNPTLSPLKANNYVLEVQDHNCMARDTIHISIIEQAQIYFLGIPSVLAIRHGYHLRELLMK